jgi:hypothetical protein
MRFGWDEVEDFRVMVIPFGRVIHVLLGNGEVVTLDITTIHWCFEFGGEAKQEQVLKRSRGWLPHQD